MMSRIGLCAAAIAVAAVSGASSANALTATISWYEVNPASSDPSAYDFNTAPATECCSYYFDNEVGSTLSGGVPVVGAGNSASLSEAVGTALPWWTPSAAVTSEGTTSVSLPLAQNMFPPEGTGNNDSAYFQTAVVTFTLPSNSGGYEITFGGDDDTFLALGNNIIGQDGGIHAYDPTQNVTVYIPASGGIVTEFYADRHIVAAYDYLSVEAVPEASTWAMLGLGFAALGFAGFRARKTSISIV